MAYKRVTEGEFRRWAAQNPGGVARINGQETSVPMPQAQDLGFFGNLARGVTKPLRAVAAMPEYLVQALSAANRGGTGVKPGEFKSIFLTPEEEIKWARNPVKEGLKSSVGLGAYLVPGGGGEAGTATGRIGTAAGRGAISGSMSGLAYSDDDQELKGALTGGALGGLIGGATQGVSELAQASRARQATQGVGVVDVSSVDDIAKLPKKTKSGLVKQAKSAGFWDDGLGESKNIQNYLNNRGLAGRTPAETLENMTQEFYRAQGLKEAGLDEIGGLSKGYIEQIKNQLDEAVEFSGLGVKDTNAVQRMKATLDKAPQNAKSLDKIAQQWYDIALTKAGDMKASQSGLYKYGAKAIRDALKTANQEGSYTQGMSVLSQILGLEDEGLIAKTAKDAARQGVDIPLFTAAGFRGADIKVPGVSNVVNKARAGIGATQETGRGLGQGVIGGLANAAQPAASVAQRVAPAVLPAFLEQGGQQEQVPQGGAPVSPQQTGPQIDQMALIRAVLNGDISTSEADWLMEMLGDGAGQQVMPKTDSGRKAMVARDAAIQALNILEQDPSAAGKLQGIENIFYDITGQANTATEYKTQIEGLRSQVFNALGGTALTPTEKKQYEKFLPKQSDSPAQAKQKLQVLIPMMEALMGVEAPSLDSNAAITNIMPWIAQ